MAAAQVQCTAELRALQTLVVSMHAQLTNISHGHATLNGGEGRAKFGRYSVRRCSLPHRAVVHEVSTTPVRDADLPSTATLDRLAWTSTQASPRGACEHALAKSAVERVVDAPYTAVVSATPCLSSAAAHRQRVASVSIVEGAARADEGTRETLRRKSSAVASNRAAASSPGSDGSDGCARHPGGLSVPANIRLQPNASRRVNAEATETELMRQLQHEQLRNARNLETLKRITSSHLNHPSAPTVCGKARLTKSDVMQKWKETDDPLFSPPTRTSSPRG